MKIKKFKIIQCNKCGHWQIMGGLIFHCKICNKTTKLKLKSKYGLNLKLIESFDTGLEAQKFLSKFNEERLKDKFMGFKMYEAKDKTKSNNFVGMCTYCREEVYENELKIYDDKPFHKKCVDKWKELGRR